MRKTKKVYEKEVGEMEIQYHESLAESRNKQSKDTGFASQLEKEEAKLDEMKRERDDKQMQIHQLEAEIERLQAEAVLEHVDDESLTCLEKEKMIEERKKKLQKPNRD